jgi:ubiquinone/menaquinone biosynthesis C-methylase UbiE
MDVAKQFDEKGARRIEAIYLTPDVVAQREAVLEALAPQPGERAVDLGCGPGLLAVEIARRVGPSGAVEAIDSSASMVPLAQRRCAEFPWVTVRLGDVVDLSYADAQFDVAVCTQVYEYVQDIERALRELKRVLRTGGRAVLMDTDWESCVWHSSDDARMRRVIECWNTHCPHPRLPRVLRRLLRDAGFRVERIAVVPLLNSAFDTQTYSVGVMEVICGYARKHLGEAEVQAWAEDLRALGANGEYFFSLNRYLFVALG